MLQRALYLAVIWLLLTGGTVFVCSSGGDPFLRPPDDDDGGSGGGSNKAPIATDGFLQTPSTSIATGSMRAVDPDGDTVTYRVTRGPQLGSLSNIDPATGQFTYVPRSAGNDSFGYRASDGRAESQTATISIVVTNAAAATGAKPLRVQDVVPAPGDSEGYGACYAAPSETMPACPPPADPAAMGLGDNALAVAADPFAQGRRLAVVAAGGMTALTSSDDAGRTWRTRYALVLEAESAHLAFHGALPGRAVAALGRDGWTRVLASRDGGRSWRTVAWVPAGPGSRVAAGWPTDDGGIPMYVSDPTEGRVWRISPGLYDN